MFEGEPRSYWASLQKLAALPRDTQARPRGRARARAAPRAARPRPRRRVPARARALRIGIITQQRPRARRGQVFCAHEYTSANARFAAAVNPGNAALAARKAAVDEARRKARGGARAAAPRPRSRPAAAGGAPPNHPPAGPPIAPAYDTPPNTWNTNTYVHSTQGEATVPSLLGDELDTNPFLRPGDPEVRAAVGAAPGAAEWEVFGAVRRAKDAFRG